MKRIIIITTFLMLLIGCKGSINSGTTQVNNEINHSLRDEIQTLKADFVESIKQKDINSLSNILSPRLLDSEDFILENYLEQIYPYITNINFILKDEYYSTMKFSGDDFTSTIIPEISREDSLIINNFKFFDKEAYNAFYLNEHKGKDVLLFLSFSKYDNEWKINIIHIGNYGIKGLNPPELYKKSNELLNLDRPISALFYSLAINKYLRPASYLQYKDEAKYASFVNESINNFNTSISFPAKISTIQIFGFNYELTDKDGIVPVILYQTEVELNKEALENEIKDLKPRIDLFTNNLQNDFPVIALRAFNELPTDKTKEYGNYTFLLNNEW